ncbi:ribosome small subunit-dependent GTPase A [Simkania negevensis]|uniref:Small ribosomal subunit biogenesis GTPase RsgA n=1 Tax=Simkania negevensis TaxID=83561 RepID=A0ABS3AQ25_9BACT|nr:ribosome small subunit-dependent GTPase A [Simkania negevensis]
MPQPWDEEEPFEDRKDSKKQRKIASKTDRSQYKKTDEKKRLQRAERPILKEGAKQGRVISIFSQGMVVASEGAELLCVLRGVLKKEVRRIKNIVTVGDIVSFLPTTEGEGVIVSVNERYSVLARAAHGQRRNQQLIAANIDQVLITTSVVSPPLKPSLVDRYIIAAYKGSITPVIVVNKIDLLKSSTQQEEQELFNAFVDSYSQLELAVFPVSAETGEGLDALRQSMHDKASAFAGQSGVGKSSLINQLLDTNLAIGDVIAKTNKGVHTTTTAQLLPIEEGGWCIDTPGIKSFGVWSVDLNDLRSYFLDIQQAGKDCKFPDCTHTHEPDCHVKQAVENQTLSLLRYRSYLKLFKEISGCGGREENKIDKMGQDSQVDGR